MTHDRYDENHQTQWQEEPMSPYTIRLTAWHARMARRQGKGNMGRGIRIAIEMAEGQTTDEGVDDGDEEQGTKQGDACGG
jgi:hypothetical protein